jgi:hypothetical protein
VRRKEEGEEKRRERKENKKGRKKEKENKKGKIFQTWKFLKK